MTATLTRPRPGSATTVPDATPVPDALPVVVVPRPSPVPRPAAARPAPPPRQAAERPDLPRVRRRRPRPTRDWFWTAGLWRAFLVLATLGAFGLRYWGSNNAYDLFIDESFYAEVGQSLARGHMPYATGSPFFLHPPGAFLVEGGWMNLFGVHTEVFPQVFSLRKLVAVIAALTALVLGLLVRRVVGATAAALVVVVYLLNAFMNRQTAFVILEPLTLLCTLAGFLVFAHLRPPGERGRRGQIVLGGLLFGLACLSKEFAVFVTLLPLGLAFLTRTWLSRREAARAIGATCLPWAVWLAVIAVTGYWNQFFTQITAGFHRTTGSKQISGFNRKGTPSFLDAILANLVSLWTAYAVLGLGTLAVLYVAWVYRADQRLRFLSFLGLGAIPLLGYCVLLGTNEEQFFNFLFFPALICLVTVVWTEWRRLARWLQVAALALLVLGLLSDTARYLVLHTTPDDGTYQVNRWMAAHVPNGTVIGTTNSVQREIFLRYAMIDDAPDTRLDPRVRYLVVFDKQVDQGYAFVDRDTVERQVQGRRIVFETHDRSNGRMVVYAIR